MRVEKADDGKVENRRRPEARRDEMVANGSGARRIPVESIGCGTGCVLREKRLDKGRKKQGGQSAKIRAESDWMRRRA
jgi:hypothetical protein